MADTNTERAYRSLYEVTGNIADINTLLVPRSEVAAKAPAAEPVATVYTMEALVPGGSVKHHVQLLKPLPAGTPLYTAPPAPTEQWVSVAERLPNPHQEVLLAIEGGHVTTGSYMPSLQCFYWEPCDDEAEDSAVTHWMNKPAPPQGAAKGAT